MRTGSDTFLFCLHGTRSEGKYLTASTRPGLGILIAIAAFSRHGYPVSRRGEQEISFFASSGDKLVLLFRRGDRESISTRYERLHLRPDYEGLLGERQPTGAELHGEFAKENLPPVFVDTLEFTAFALDQFKERMDRDAVSLVILASHRTKVLGKRLFDRLHALAEARSIPIIDQYDRTLAKLPSPKGWSGRMSSTGMPLAAHG